MLMFIKCKVRFWMEMVWLLSFRLKLSFFGAKSKISSILFNNMRIAKILIMRAMGSMIGQVWSGEKVFGH